MKRLRVGVIGAGSWAVASHLPNLLRRGDEVELVAVSRLGAEPLARIKEQFGFAIASEDYREVLAAGIDLCVIASPAGLHHEHATAALEAGAHVLLEKPVTIQPADAWDLVETARRSGRHALIAYGWNYYPMVREAKRLMAAGGGIGEIENVMIQMSSATRELLANRGAYADSAPETAPEQATWTDPARSGGGYAQAQLTHALGLALWLTGLRGSEVFALMASALDAPVELHDAIALRFQGGAIGTMGGASAHRGANDNKHHLEVRAIGSEGQLHIDVEREIVWRYRGPGDDVRIIPEPGAGFYHCPGPVEAIVDLALGRPAENCSPLELGARTVEILDAAYRSARSGRMESLHTGA